MVDDLEVSAPPGLPPAAGTLRQLLDFAVASIDGGDARERERRWREIKSALDVRNPVRGWILLTLDAGAFIDLGAGVYGFAPRLELPGWVPRLPRQDCVGRELDGMVIAIDNEAGAALISPRLLVLRRARAAVDTYTVVHGSLVSGGPGGLTVDLGGVRGFVPLRELLPAALLTDPEPGSAWNGYVTSIGDTGPVLSQQPPDRRTKRARQRRDALARLAPGELATGQVTRVGSAGALVAFDDGLVWGDVPRAALRTPAGRCLRRGAMVRFRIVSRDHAYPAELVLWPVGSSERA
jgi:hypothetical protein